MSTTKAITSRRRPQRGRGNQRKQKNTVAKLTKKVVQMKLVNQNRGRVARGIVQNKLRSAIAQSSLTKQLPHELAYLIMNPTEAVNFRWINPVDCAENPTAVCQQHYYKEFVQTLSTQSTELGMGTSLIVLFRDIVRAFVIWQPNPTPATPMYYAYQMCSTQTSLSWTPPISWALTTNENRARIPIDPVWWATIDQPGLTFPLFTPGSPNTIVNTVASWSPHETYLYTGNKIHPSPSPGTSYVYLNLGDTYIVDMIFNGSVDNGVGVTLSLYAGLDVPDLDQQKLTSTSSVAVIVTVGSVNNVYVNWTIATSGYYSLTIEDSTTGTSNFQSLQAWVYGKGDCFCQRAIPSFKNNWGTFTNVRMNAASALVTNTASALNRSGTVTGAFVADGSNLWCNQLTSDSLDKLSGLPRQQTETYPFAKGLYTYLRPVKSHEMTMANPVTILSGGIVGQVNFCLDNQFPYTMIFMRATQTAGGSPSTTVTPALEYLFHYDAAIEYESNSQIVEVHQAVGHTSDYVAAMDIMRGAPLFFENPLHLAGLANAALSVGKWLGPAAVSAVGGFLKSKLASRLKGTSWEPLFN